MTENDLLFERPTSIESFTDFLLVFINDITGGMWSAVIPMLVFGLVFLRMNQSPRQAFAAASYATFVIVVFLIPFGILGSQALLISLLMVGLAVAVNKGRGGPI